MSSLFYFQQMDEYWERHLPNLEKYERDQIFAGLRCDLPLVVTAWDTVPCALISEPELFSFNLDNHPNDHGIIITRTQNRGLMKLDERVIPLGPSSIKSPRLIYVSRWYWSLRMNTNYQWTLPLRGQKKAGLFEMFVFSRRLSS